MGAKPADKRTNSTTTLMTLKKDLFPAVETSNILEQPSFNDISQQQIPVLVLENRTSSSTTLLSSSGTVDPPHQTPCGILGQQQQSYDQGNNKLIEQDTAKVETEGNSTTFMNSSWGLEPSHHLPEKLQELFCKQANNRLDKEETARVESEGNFSTLMNSCGILKPPDQLHKCLGQDQLFYKQAKETNMENSAIVEIGGKCQNCGDEQSPRWSGGLLRFEILCHACRMAICKAKGQRGTAVEIEKQCCPSPATGELTTSAHTFSVLQELSLTESK